MVEAVGTNLDKFFGPGDACGPWPKKVRTTARPKSERKNAIGFISPSLQMNASTTRANLRTKRQRLESALELRWFLSALQRILANTRGAVRPQNGMNLPGGDPGAQNFLADIQNLHGLGFAEHLGLAATNRALRLRRRHVTLYRLAAHGPDRYFDSSFRKS